MLYDITAVQFSKMLQNLSAILEKGELHAEAKKFDFEVLLSSRLAPDQFTLARQVQITCDTAKLAVARLAGVAASAPKHEDNETTLAELQQRIASVRDYLAGFKAEDFSEAAEREILLPWWDGKALTGQNFALQFAQPNFYFHLSTVYAILRHNGVDLGKMDFLGSLPFKES
jgi:hypothetical protein